ncbi:hypothetical protein ABT369_53180 [Dactylosporangium sp. NPDC000244]|uniref:hypothetical protein n=1 Tax=Dactylosporangium sp. NPDC000244 TaxID=3154365 RepID=UPI003333AC36
MPKGHGFDKVRLRYPNAYRSWSEADDERLKRRHRDGAPVQDLVKEFGRTRGGIWARLERLGLVTLPGSPRRDDT